MAVGFSAFDFNEQFDYDAEGKAIYQGWSVPGSLVSESKWRICKFNYNSSSLVASIAFASGSVSFNKIWDNRTGYTYS